MDKYDLTNSLKYVVGKTQVSRLMYKRKDGKNIKTKEVAKLIKSFSEKGKTNNFRIAVRANKIDGAWTTLKSLDTDFNVDEYEDYYMGRVKNEEKFTEFFNIEFIIHYG